MYNAGFLGFEAGTRRQWFATVDRTDAQRGTPPGTVGCGNCNGAKNETIAHNRVERAYQSSLTIFAMPYFLFKTEPEAYSFDDFLRDKETVWDGVTNPVAVKNLREMPKGTKWIFYHTGDERRAVGTATVTSVDASDPRVPIVRVKVGKHLKTPKTLDEIKAEPMFKDSPLVRIGRLSVVPLTEEQWNWFVE